MDHGMVQRIAAVVRGGLGEPSGGPTHVLTSHQNRQDTSHAILVTAKVDDLDLALR